jgi:hypothetical protein
MSIWSKLMNRSQTEEAAEISAEMDQADTQQEIPPAAPVQRAWAPQSRNSLRTERTLLKDLERRKALKRRAEAALERLGEDKQRLLGQLEDGETWTERPLSVLLEHIADEERKLKVFTEESEKAQGALDEFRAALAAHAPERAQIQENIAYIAGELVVIDAENQLLLDKLQKNVKAREDLASLIREEAYSIELKCQPSFPTSFLEALAFDMASASQAWKGRFLGEAGSLPGYVVIDKEFEAPETLAQSAVCKFGDVVYLPEADALEFLRNDRPVPKTPAGGGWQSLPPTLATVEAFEAAKAEAKRLGWGVPYYLQRKHEELEQKRREGWLAERRGTLTPGTRVW